MIRLHLTSALFAAIISFAVVTVIDRPRVETIIGIATALLFVGLRDGIAARRKARSR